MEPLLLSHSRTPPGVLVLTRRCYAQFTYIDCTQFFFPDTCSIREDVFRNGLVYGQQNVFALNDRVIFFRTGTGSQPVYNITTKVIGGALLPCLMQSKVFPLRDAGVSNWEALREPLLEALRDPNKKFCKISVESLLQPFMEMPGLPFANPSWISNVASQLPSLCICNSRI